MVRRSVCRFPAVFLWAGVLLGMWADPGAAWGRAAVAARGGRAALETALELAAVWSAAEVARELGHGVQEYWTGTAGPGESIYSVEVTLDAASWADWLSDPDVFLVLERVGGPMLFVPEVRANYDGSRAIVTFRCPTLRPGSRCVLRLLDDDSTSNAVWNAILSSRSEWQVRAQPLATLPTGGVEPLTVTADATGSLQVLSPSGELYVINAPDRVAVAQFTVPVIEPSDRWEMEGEFVHGGKAMGSLCLTHWYTHPLGPVWRRLAQPGLLLWSVLSLGIVGLLVRWRCRREEDQAIGPEPFDGE